MRLRDCMPSMAKKKCFARLLEEYGFQTLVTEVDIQMAEELLLKWDCSYFFQLMTLYFPLLLWITTFLCSSIITSSIYIQNVIQRFFMHQKQNLNLLNQCLIHSKS